MIKKPENQQHHGNLKEALIQAGLQLLEDEGLSALTLRRCATLAGVSHAAPAHHFDGLKGLKTAIATRGLRIFDQTIRNEIAKAGDGLRDQALAMCRGYIRFSTEHNALYNLVFDGREKFFTDEPEWQKALADSRVVLKDISSGFVHGPGGEAATQVALYSMAMGYAKLLEIGSIMPGSGGERDVNFEDIFEMLNLRVASEVPNDTGN